MRLARPAELFAASVAIPVKPKQQNFNAMPANVF